MRSIGDLHRGNSAWQSGVLVDLDERQIHRLAGKSHELVSKGLIWDSNLRHTYQFPQSVLSLLVNSLHTLVHSLLLFFQDLGVCALLQTLEDLEVRDESVEALGNTISHKLEDAHTLSSPAKEDIFAAAMARTFGLRGTYRGACRSR